MNFPIALEGVRLHGLRFKLMLVTFSVFSLALNGCETHKQDSNVQAEGDSRVEQVEAQLVELTAQGIELTPSTTNEYEDAFTYIPPAQLRRLKRDPQIKEHLKNYINNIRRLRDLARHHGIKIEKSALDQYRRSAAIAKRYLDLMRD